MMQKAAALFLMLLAAAYPLSASARTLQIEDSRRIVTLDEPAISPDGTRIAVVATHSDYQRASYRNELLLVSVSSGSVARIAGGDDVAVPRWSPDGSQLAYLAKARGAYQVFVRPASGQTRRITNAPGGVDDFAWRPDGKAVLFGAYDVLPQRDYFDVGENDYTATAPAPPLHLWIVDASGRSPRRLTSGTWTVAPTDPGGIFTSQFAWSGDSRRVYFTRVETTFSGANQFSTLRVIDVATGRTAKLTENPAFEFAPMPSPSGAQLLYSYPLDGNYLAENMLHLRAGGRDTVLTAALDRNIGGAMWLPGERSLLMCGNDGAHVAAWTSTLDGRTAKLHLGDLNVGCDSYSSSEFDSGIAASVSRNGTIAFIATTPSHPRELYVLASTQGVPRRLTNLNAFVDGLETARMTQFAWRDSAGGRRTGVVTYPPGMQPNRKYPIVLLIHGGPGLASVDEFAWEGWPLAQLIAARGYIVFQPNYRGSDDSGNAYMLGIYRDSVAGPSQDILGGLAAVKELPQSDPSDVAVCGWSYGGLLTSWLITQVHDWRAAVSGAAVNDEVQSYDLSVSNVQDRYYLGTSPYAPGGMQIYREQSPITFADRITTPTLIWSTTGDPVVPTSMSYGMYRALRDRGVPVRFVQFVASTHGPSNPRNTEELTHIWLDWLDAHLKGARR